MTNIAYLVLSFIACGGVIYFAMKRYDMTSTDNTSIKIPSTSPDLPPSAVLPVETSNVAPFPKMILKWADAITHWEGAKPSSNNPGNMKYASLTKSWGATKGRPAADGGFFCQFTTPEAGRTALCSFLLLGAEGQLIISHPLPCTLDAFTTRFAGNPPQGYKNGISQMLGVPLSTDIKTFLV